MAVVRYVDGADRDYFFFRHDYELSDLPNANLNTLGAVYYESDGRYYKVSSNDYEYYRIDGKIHALVYGELIYLKIETWDSTKDKDGNDVIRSTDQGIYAGSPPGSIRLRSWYCVEPERSSYSIEDLPRPYSIINTDVSRTHHILSAGATYEYFEWNNNLYFRAIYTDDETIDPITLVPSSEIDRTYYCSLKSDAETPYSLNDLGELWCTEPDADYLILDQDSFGGYFLLNRSLYARYNGKVVPVFVSGYSGVILENKPDLDTEPIEANYSDKESKRVNFWDKETIDTNYWENFEVRDIDWLSSMQQTFEFYEVDPNTWGNKRQLTNILSCSLTRDRDNETLGHASISTTEELGECYVRIYLVAFQNRTERKFPLGVYLCQTPSIKFNGRHKDISIDAYTPLIELKEKLPPLGYSIITGRNVMDVAAILTRNNVRAPIARATDAATVPFDFCADTGDTWLTFLTDFIAAAGYEFDLDEMGRVMFVPKQDLNSMQPVWVYNDDNSSILYPDVTLSRDLYGIPNVVEVTYSHDNKVLYAKAANNNEDSSVSTASRGREIVYRSDNPEMVGIPTQEQLNEYALNLLRDLSSIEYTVTYSHGYCPVRVGDCVRLNYSRAGFEGINAKVIRQTIKCEPGCPVEETAVYTVSLFGGGTIVAQTPLGTNGIEWEQGAIRNATGEAYSSMHCVRTGYIDYIPGMRIINDSIYDCWCHFYSSEGVSLDSYVTISAGSERTIETNEGNKIRLDTGDNNITITPEEIIPIRIKLPYFVPTTPAEDKEYMEDDLVLCDELILDEFDDFDYDSYAYSWEDDTDLDYLLEDESYDG